VDEVGYGVIGVGFMGTNHARNLAHLSNAKLLGVVDTDQNKARTVSLMYGCEKFTDYQALLRQPAIRAVSVCLPTSMHEQVVTDALEAGKHVLVEKPIASTVTQALKMQATASAQGRILMVGHIERFNPAVQRAKKVIDQQLIGNIVSIIARRVGLFPPRIQDADIAIDLAIHDIDVINYLLGTLPTEIRVDRQRQHLDKRDDSVHFLLRYPQTTAYVQANWITPVKIRKLNITGTDGYMELDYIAQSVKIHKSNYDKSKELDQATLAEDFVLKFREPDYIEEVVEATEPLSGELAFFVDAVRSGKKINSDHAVDALRVVLAESRPARDDNSQEGAS